MKKIILALFLAISFNELSAQSFTDPSVGDAAVSRSPLGDVGSQFTTSFTLSNLGMEDISGADAANNISFVVQLYKSVPDFEAPNIALDALSGAAMDIFDFTYDAVNNRFVAQQKTGIPIAAFSSHDLIINCKVAELSADESDYSIGADLTITPPSSSALNEESNDFAAALTRTASVLPVELVSFTAAAHNCEVQLDWTTFLEEKFSHFVVEHSFDSKTFRAVQVVKGKNSFTGSSYRLVVNSTKADAYYRLRMVDIDGKHTYSDVVHTRSSCNASVISIAPNPVTNNTVTIKGLPAYSVIKLMDMNGKNLQTVRSSGAIQEMHLGHLPSGIYFLYILRKNELIETVKLLKE